MNSRYLLATCLLLFPLLSYALGLGKLEVKSSLNEPFDARIELTAKADELDTLKILLADQDAFDRAGIIRSAILSKLFFKVQETDKGPDYIHVYSDEPIREPFLNFLLEVSWSKGRLYREYTALLDPPIYANSEARKKLAQHTQPSAAPVTGKITKGIEDNHVVYNPEYKARTTGSRRASTTSPSVINYSGGDYGPVNTGDTLWSIAKAMRPDTSVSIQQMMLALLRANPDAFINNNINGLKRGQVLKMPEMTDIKSVSQDAAFAEAKSQNNLWQEARGAMATTVTKRPEGAQAPAATPPSPAAAPAEKPAATAPAEKTESELRLVAPVEKGEGTAEGGKAGEGELKQELAIANESLEALKMENSDLKDKLSETEAIVDDLKRLIVLKENELATMQQQATKQAAGTPETATPAPQQPAAETKPAPAPEAAPKPEPAKPEEAKAPAPKPAVKPAAKPAPEPVKQTSMIPASVSGIINILKDNILYVAIALGGLIVVLGAVLFLKNRRTTVVIDEAAEMDQFEIPPDGSEDMTDISPDLDAEAETQVAGSEDETILPGSEEETELPVFGDDDATQLADEAAAAPAAEEEEEEDPLAEVNVFLAYEHFDEAENFVKNALKEDPDNLEFHNKLLEVYYAANNKKGYEEAAKVLHDKVGGEGDYWNMAVAMWQEMSPNRALFEEPAEGEEEDSGTEASGGGIVDISAGEGEEAGGLDLDFAAEPSAEESAAESDVADMAEPDEEGDILDVTAAVDEDELLDVTAAVDTESVEEDAGLDISLDNDDNETDDVAAVDKDALDLSFDVAEEEPAAAEEEGLDISLGDDEPAEKDDNSLDMSFDVADEEPAAAEEEGLDMSLDVGDEEPAAAEEEGMDISLGDDESAEKDENSLDFSLDIPSGGEAESATEDDGALDLSLDSAAEEESSEDISLDMSDAGAEETDKASETASRDDLLDVTTSAEYDLDNDQDLLDVTTSASMAGLDEDELHEKEDDQEAEGDVDSLAETEAKDLDFEISPDADAGGEASEEDNGLSFDGIDITAEAEETSESDSLDLGITDDEKSESSEDDFELDMDSTMQVPSRSGILSDKSSSDDEPMDLIIDEDDGDADHTIMVPKSGGSDAQSEEDEIATQLDLAKAYVELGDTENAKTILGEIISIGNAEQKKQAEELLAQI